MAEIEFAVSGSAKEPYQVQFVFADGSLTAYCTCPAGTYGNFCKHRLNILSGDVKAVVSGNEQEVAQVQSWLVGTELATAVTELVEAQANHDSAKKRLDQAKKNIKRALQG